MLAVKLKGRVTSDRRLVVKLPEDIEPGTVEVIVLHEKPAPASEPRARRKATHPGFGIWAKRKDIADSAEFAAQLRRQVEHWEDGRE